MKNIFLPIMLVLISLNLGAKKLTAENDNQPCKCKSGWLSIPLNDTIHFNADARYRVKLFNDDGNPAAGWVYPIIISPSFLFMIVSSKLHAFASVAHNKKDGWHYRKMGDVANKPIGYENFEKKIAELQMIID